MLAFGLKFFFHRSLDRLNALDPAWPHVYPIASALFHLFDQNLSFYHFKMKLLQ